MSTLDKVLMHTDTNDEFIRQLMSSLVVATKTSNEIPSGDEYSYQSTFPQFVSLSEECADGAAKVIQHICNFIEPGNKLTNLPDDLLDPSLYTHIVDVIDKLLEIADTKLDQLTGKGERFAKSVQLSMAVDKDRLLRANVMNIQKPQLLFLNEIDNSRNRPFYPRLTYKPHAIVPLDLTEQQTPVSNSSSSSVTDIVVNGPSTFYAHPYESELRKLKYGNWQLSQPNFTIPQLTVPIPDERPFAYVETKNELRTLVSEIISSDAKEIALDLENHSFRSFQGISCLLQVP